MGRDETPARTPAPPLRGRLGAAAFLAAAVTCLPVFFFDDLEGWIGDVGLALGWEGLDGGSTVLLLIVAAFLFLWLVAVALLAAISPAPSREGFWAGLIVAGMIALALVSASLEQGDWVILALAFPIFGGLAMGLGALAGNVAQRWQTGRVPSSRATSIVAIGCGVLLLLACIPFLPVGAGAWGVPVAVFSCSALLVGGGLWGLQSARRAS